MAIRKHLSTLVICLLTVFALGCLLPVTALAAAPSGQVIYVGDEAVTSDGYWTTDDSGNVTAYSGEGTPTDNYIHYDTANNTLTLHNATIKESVSSDTSTSVVGVAIGVFNQNGAAELIIQLEGTNTITEVSAGIYVLAFSNSTGDASLTIMGSGSLDTSGSYNPAITVQSNGGNATLSIENAKVTATASSSGSGVLVRSKNDSSVSLTVDGGTVDDGIKNSLGDSVKYAPSITTTNLPNGTMGTSYGQTLAATGSGTITWSIADGSSLPAGLRLNEGNAEYWTCKTCGKIFSDAAGKTEITLADTVIHVTNHNHKDGKCTVCGDTDPNYQEPTSPTKDEPTAEDSTKNTKDNAVTKSSTPQTSDTLFGYAVFFVVIIVLASIVSVVAYRKLHTVQAKHSSSNKH